MTQAALAERIAALEGLDSPPRGLVNRVCRGEAVDPPSVERVARALGVPAWSLYLGSDEPAATAVETAPPGHSEPILRAPGLNPTRWWPVAVVVVLLAAGLWWAGSRESGRNTAGQPVVTPLRAIVLPIPGADGAVIGQALGQALDRHWRTLPYSTPSAGAAQPQDLLLSGGVDRVIEPRRLDDGRWTGLVLYVHQRGAMREAWGGAWRRSIPPQALPDLWQQAATAVVTENEAQIRTRAALEKYLSARRHLDAANTELNVRRALTDFESALRLDPGYIDSRAGLCEALVTDNVRTGDAARLTEAARECDTAGRAATDNLELRRAQAFLDRKRGKLVEALAGFKAVLAVAPRNVDALLGLAEVQLTRHARGEDPTALAAAEDAARLAQTIEPQFWKPPFTLARVLYAGGRLDEAVAAAELSVARNANVPALSNLGTFRFCRGDFRSARSAYEQAQAVDPAAYAGDAQLAIVLYFLRDYAGAAQLLERAVGLHAASGKPEEHRLWGNYADALRRSGDRSAAESAYQRAIALAERDADSGDGNPLHASYRAFYYEMLAQLDPGRWSSRRRRASELAQLGKVGDPLAKLQLAAVQVARGNRAAATQLIAQAGPGCPGYLRSPDL